jgi:type IV pilus assembly protein PilM
MSIAERLSQLLEDPPAPYAFELSETGIASAQAGKPPRMSFAALEPEVIAVSPVRDNVLQPDLLAAAVASLAPKGESRKRRQAALILPDHAVRLTVLDFDSFPTKAEEQEILVRFRLKRAVPFDVESAALSYTVQPSSGDDKKVDHKKKVDVVAAVAPLEIVARYEAPFRAAGFQPGLVTVSAAAAANLLDGKGMTLLLKLSGHVLTLAVFENRVLKLVRTIELANTLEEELYDHLMPTFAYVEDQIGRGVERVVTSGLNAAFHEKLRQELQGMGVGVEPLRSRLGPVEQGNAGLLGYLQGMEHGA